VKRARPFVPKLIEGVGFWVKLICI
jgi:hypothetical protein